jgi:hypothetical protein
MNFYNDNLKFFPCEKDCYRVTFAGIDIGHILKEAPPHAPRKRWRIDGLGNPPTLHHGFENRTYAAEYLVQLNYKTIITALLNRAKPNEHKK